MSQVFYRFRKANCVHQRLLISIAIVLGLLCVAPPLAAAKGKSLKQATNAAANAETARDTALKARDAAKQGTKEGEVAAGNVVGAGSIDDAKTFAAAAETAFREAAGQQLLAAQAATTADTEAKNARRIADKKHPRILPELEEQATRAHDAREAAQTAANEAAQFEDAARRHNETAKSALNIRVAEAEATTIADYAELVCEIARNAVSGARDKAQESKLAAGRVAVVADIIDARNCAAEAQAALDDAEAKCIAAANAVLVTSDRLTIVKDASSRAGETAVSQAAIDRVRKAHDVALIHLKDACIHAAHAQSYRDNANTALQQRLAPGTPLQQPQDLLQQQSAPETTPTQTANNQKTTPPARGAGASAAVTQQSSPKTSKSTNVNNSVIELKASLPEITSKPNALRVSSDRAAQVKVDLNEPAHIRIKVTPVQTSGRATKGIPTKFVNTRVPKSGKTISLGKLAPGRYRVEVEAQTSKDRRVAIKFRLVVSKSHSTQTRKARGSHGRKTRTPQHRKG